MKKRRSARPEKRQSVTENPRVCIVTPVFNGSAFIDQTLHSLISQAGTFRLRIHIQDGGSTDGTVDKIRKWKERVEQTNLPAACEEIQLTWNSAPDRGMYDALNQGFKAVDVQDADILGWLNSDDVLAPGAIQFACQRMAQWPEVSWIVSRPCESDGGGVMRKIHAPQVYNQKLLHAGLHDDRHLAFVMQEGSFWRGWLWKQSGGLRGDLRLAGDYDLWRRFAALAAPYSCEQVLALHRRHSTQLSAQADKYLGEIDSTALSGTGQTSRDEIWAEYQRWVADPQRDSRFAGNVIVYNPGPDTWTIEHRQPPVQLGPTLFVRPDGTGHRMVACQLGQGFTAPEGPYPHLRLPAGIRFAPPGPSVVKIDAPSRGSYWLLTHYRHFTPGLRLTVSAGGQDRHTLEVPPTFHERNGLMVFQIMLQAGQNDVGYSVELPVNGSGPGLLVIDIEALPAAAVFS